MEQILHQGLLQGWGPVGAEISVQNVSAEVGWFFEGDRGGFGKEVLG